MKRNLMLLAAGALATGLIAAGCGDDNDDESSDTGTDVVAAPTKAEFVAEGNAICKQGTAELDAAAKEVFKGGEPTPAEEEAFINDTLVPNVQGQIDEIRALGIPEGDEAVVNGFLDDAEAALADLQANPTFRGGDPFADVNKDLAAYGLTTCSDG